MSDEEQEIEDGKGWWGIYGSYHHSPQKNKPHDEREREERWKKDRGRERE